MINEKDVQYVVMVVVVVGVRGDDDMGLWNGDDGYGGGWWIVEWGSGRALEWGVVGVWDGIGDGIIQICIQNPLIKSNNDVK